MVGGEGGREKKSGIHARNGGGGAEGQRQCVWIMFGEYIQNKVLILGGRVVWGRGEFKRCENCPEDLSGYSSTSQWCALAGLGWWWISGLYCAPVVAGGTKTLINSHLAGLMLPQCQQLSSAVGGSAVSHPCTRGLSLSSFSFPRTNTKA